MRVDTIAGRISTYLRQQPGSLGLFTSAELSAGAINDAQLQVCVDTNYIKRFGVVNTVSGTYRYALSASYMCPDLLTFYKISYDNIPLLPARVDNPSFTYASDRATGTPYSYRIWENKIELYPTPTEAKELRVMYSARPVDLSAASMEPEIPPEYQQAMIFYACALLSVKDEKEMRYNSFYLKYSNIIKRLWMQARGFDSDDQIALEPSNISARRH
jgi:hypothetical protein